MTPIPPWLVLRADLSADWDAFHAYWQRIRAKADRVSQQAGADAFEAQQRAATQLVEAAWAEQARAEALRRAQAKAARHAAGLERRRQYQAAWMRAYRARQKVGEGPLGRRTADQG